jgi:lysophospholipase L1-like esterase
MPPRPKILLLGDSLTQLGWDGWAGQLAHAYQRRADVVNRGMAGYNTKWFLQYADSGADVWDQGSAVKLITIFFGANDSSCIKLNSRHHVPLDDFKSNLEILITKCQETYGKDAPIVLMAAPPVVHEQRLSYQKERYGDKATGDLERTMELSSKYAQAALEVAEKHKLPSVDLWKLMQEEKNWESFFYDGLHFTTEGNKFVADALLEEIKKSYPKLAVIPDPLTKQWANSASVCEDVMQDGPYHDEIDAENPTKAFEEHTSKKQKLG